jgi:Holliday junction resolvasome RuvABC DNA-binding subunit
MNAQVARMLEEAADLLEHQHANPFRVQAYRNAANTVRELPRGVLQILHEDGLEGLDRLPTIGPALARAIQQIVTIGRLPMLDRLRGESDPIAVLSSVPGIGQELARRLHEELDIDTLEELETAAHDGTLSRVPGFGAKRIAGIREALAARLGQRPPRGRTEAKSGEPTVAEILDVDREYRDASAAGRLRTIAPRRFNPKHEAWLPVMHTWRGGRHYTALFSNTARAHQLGRTRDWVVLYFDGDHGERQHTVVTATSGPLEGRRVVRGRELECEQYYVER